MTQVNEAYRYADRHGEGWLRNGPGDTYTTYPLRDLGELTHAELTAQRGPLRPVEAMTEQDSQELARALAGAGKKATATLLVALNHVAKMLLERNGTAAALTAGRPGSWEAELLRHHLPWEGEDIGPGRVDAGALETCERLLEQWTTGPVQVELAETLPSILDSAARQAGGWPQITDRWLAGDEAIERWTAAYR